VSQEWISLKGGRYANRPFKDKFHAADQGPAMGSEEPAEARLRDRGVLAATV